MRIIRPSAVGVAAGLMLIAIGSCGLASGHSGSAVAKAPAVPPVGKPTVPAPSVPASPSASPGPAAPGSGVLKDSYATSPGQAGTQASPPRWLTIPDLNVNRAPVLGLGLSKGQYPASAELPKGSLDTTPLNSDPGKAGWYDLGVRPGDIGPAIIAGHINYNTPGVFANLPQMRAGELVYVGLADGSVVKFTVTKVATNPKSHFPTGSVYGSTGDAELRLIGCSGDTVVNGHYLNNTIVYATKA